MSPRTYSQGKRAEATEQSRQAILTAAQELFRDEGRFELPLDEVAERAGCSERTVIRHFGSKEGLLVAAMAAGERGVMESRKARPEDVAGSIRGLVDHYEEDGDLVLRWLSLADRYPLVRQVTESGTRLHEDWVEEVFSADLAALTGSERRRRKAVLTSLTDVHVWALLRRRQGLGRKATEAALLDLVEHARGEGR
ncbi:MAG TPA: TetR family transcriptional regulator [Solirubrobacterales bacterium]|nr:TetR family transcriptional regulator [Solirubrobacterales bacterium]